jgi:hypothetical protein
MPVGILLRSVLLEYHVQFTSEFKVQQSNESNSFADDLIVLTRGASTKEAENYANQDLKKIERMAADNKIEFNDKQNHWCYLYQEN